MSTVACLLGYSHEIQRLVVAVDYSPIEIVWPDRGFCSTLTLIFDPNFSMNICCLPNSNQIKLNRLMRLIGCISSRLNCGSDGAAKLLRQRRRLEPIVSAQVGLSTFKRLPGKMPTSSRLLLSAIGFPAAAPDIIRAVRITSPVSSLRSTHV